jgi:hypothetical protein
MIESNTVIIFDNDKNLIRKTVPGHDVNDVNLETGEPRRIVYHWPNVYIDPTADSSAPEEPPAASLPYISNGTLSGPHHTDGPGDNGRGTAAGNGDSAAITLSVLHDQSAVGVSVTRGG